MKKTLLLIASAMLIGFSCTKAPQTAEGDPSSDTTPSSEPGSSEDPSVSDDPSEFVMEAVDLGLDVLWANCNIGATTPEGYGNHYAWGDTEVREDYSWDSYIFSTEAHDGINFIEYNIKGMTLEQKDDVAHKELGPGWRIPTNEDFLSLRDNCKWEWETVEKVNGYRVTNEATGASIFLPAAGFIERGNKVSARGSFGKYWASDLRSDTPALANNLSFTDTQVATDSYPYRCRGFSIRAVFPRYRE